ncbi:hypothetical protein CMQ_3337 [Grosmannia clavigera kw1407]|uniref:Uncharacterized protein n=1 Tax=Grosmannia clavigera (strain kw1407 / UAMH 11150) TaxID=655863 RepID=F0XAF3_GROCL|nr:uncharacterized protein CMQ_3337 [Grosmannia clavigera kw1407]EFX05268.1 hypothetical protein CMQ_3337 [Grosmannia clavigera kw1407]
MTARAVSTLAPAAAVMPRTMATASATATAEAAVSTLPVFVPGFEPDQWSLLRGSIIGSATGSAAETTVTIFCDDQSTLSCQLDNILPFVVTEGPSSLHYAESLSGSLTVAIDCQLDNTTAAACTVYSSCGPGLGRASAFETEWCSTLTAPNVRWGVLTLSDPPGSLATTSASSLLHVVPWATVVVLAICLAVL